MPLHYKCTEINWAALVIIWQVAGQYNKVHLGKICTKWFCNKWLVFIFVCLSCPQPWDLREWNLHAAFRTVLHYLLIILFTRLLPVNFKLVKTSVLYQVLPNAYVFAVLSSWCLISGLLIVWKMKSSVFLNPDSSELSFILPSNQTACPCLDSSTSSS